MKTSPLLPTILGVLISISSVSTVMYLPAFPAIETTFAAPKGSAQITLAAWFIGLALGQAIQGVLSDGFGRRTPLICGILVYTAASAGCALATDIESLAALRFFAALGCSAPTVIPRAMVRDIATGQVARHLLAKLILVMGVGPIVAPIGGSLLLNEFGWRAIFWFCTGYGLISCAVASAFVPETLPQQMRMTVMPAHVLALNLRILGEPGFVTNVVMSCFAMFTLYAYITSSPAILIEFYGYSSWLYSVAYAIWSVCYILSAQINAHLFHRFGGDAVLGVASATMLLVSIGLPLVAFLQPQSGALTVLAVGIVMLCTGVIFPNASVGALAQHASSAGSAAALLSALQLLAAAAGSMLVGYFSDGKPLGPWMLTFLGAFGTLIADRYRAKREPRDALNS